MSSDVHPTPIRSVTARDHDTALAEAGVRVIHRCYDGAVHGCMTRPDIAIGAAQARERMGWDLRRLLGHDDGSWDA